MPHASLTVSQEARLRWLAGQSSFWARTPDGYTLLDADALVLISMGLAAGEFGRFGSLVPTAAGIEWVRNHPKAT